MEEQKKFKHSLTEVEILYDIYHATLGFLNLHKIAINYEKLDIKAHCKLVDLLSRQLQEAMQDTKHLLNKE